MIFVTALRSMRSFVGTAPGLTCKVAYRFSPRTWGMPQFPPPLTISTSSSRSELSPVPGLPNVTDRSSRQWQTQKGVAHENEFQSARLVPTPFFHGTSPSGSLHESAHHTQLSRQSRPPFALSGFSRAPTDHSFRC